MALSAEGAAPALPPAPIREPRVLDFARLKFLLLRNGFRGQTWRVVAFSAGLAVGLILALFAFLGLAVTASADRDLAMVVAVFAGSAVVLGWALIPLLFFGVDETLDPARFALLPVPPRVLARGMLAAALIGVPALATLIATGGLAVAAGFRGGPVVGLAGLVGVLAGLLLGVLASRAVTSAFASLLRSRKVRDLAAVIIAVLASSVAPLQWLIMSAVEGGSLDQSVRIADVVAWLPVGAPYALPFDVLDGAWAAAAGRLAVVIATGYLLLRWWASTMESAMADTGSAGGARASGPVSGGAVRQLIPGFLRGITPASPFGAIYAREYRSWWRDARRRASLISILMASAVLPITLTLAGDGRLDGARLGGGTLSFSVSLAGTIGGLLLGNQFAFDGNAYAAHLLARVRGRTELRARAAALCTVALPVITLVVVGVTVLAGEPALIPHAVGILAAGFGAAIAAASLLSVLAPYALPDTSNPFALNSGGGGAKGLLAIVAMVATLVIAAPVTVGGAFLPPDLAAWLMPVGGLLYGLAAVFVGTALAGAILDQRGPEVLAAITPRR